MSKPRKARVLILFGSLLLLITVLWVSLLFNATRNFAKLQEVVQSNPATEARYYCAAYRRGAACQIYTLAVELDLRFYPNEYIVITKFDSGALNVDLMSGPGPENTITLVGEDGWQYLATMKLNLPR